MRWFCICMIHTPVSAASKEKLLGVSSWANNTHAHICVRIQQACTQHTSVCAYNTKSQVQHLCMWTYTRSTSAKSLCAYNTQAHICVHTTRRHTFHLCAYNTQAHICVHTTRRHTSVCIQHVDTHLCAYNTQTHICVRIQHAGTHLCAHTTCTHAGTSETSECAYSLLRVNEYTVNNLKI